MYRVKPRHKGTSWTPTLHWMSNIKRAVYKAKKQSKDEKSFLEKFDIFSDVKITNKNVFLAIYYYKNYEGDDGIIKIPIKRN